MFSRRVKDEDADVSLVVVGWVHGVECFLSGSVPEVDLNRVGIVVVAVAVDVVAATVVVVAVAVIYF